MNKTKNMKIRFRNIGIGILITMCVVVGVSTFTQYEGTHAQSDENSSGASKCITEMTPFVKEKSTEFRTYLEKHFSNKSTNSSLLEAALLKFQQVEKEIFEKLNTYSPKAGQDLTTEISALLNCRRVVEDEVLLMKSLMKRFAIKTNQIKVTSALQTKMAEINKKLSNLDKQFTLMLGQYETLSNRMPCFVQQCIN